MGNVRMGYVQVSLEAKALAQECFNKVYEHFIIQGNKPSVRNGPTDITTCLYRGPDGTKCAVGVLIDDDEYVETMEGPGVAHLFELFPNLRIVERLPRDPYEKTCVVEVLQNLQRAHDYQAQSGWNLPAFRDRLNAAAETYNLWLPRPKGSK